MIVDVVIPVLNEEAALPKVLQALPKDLIRKVVVVDNGSIDNSGAVAEKLGAHVILEPRQGYGRAVWSGIEYLMADPPEVVVFCDGDAADDPTELYSLLDPIKNKNADLVIGSRMKGNLQAGSMSPAQRIGNILVPILLRILYKASYSDLGPFRAIKWQQLMDLKLVDRGFGFTVEMQIKAARNQLQIAEVPVSYRPRIGESKISGTLGGTVKASARILWTVARYLRR